MKRQIMSLPIVILLAISLPACITNKYILTTYDDIPIDNTGTVLGRVTLQRFFGLGAYNADASLGRGLCLKNVETSKIFGVSGANYFYLKLPEGTYELCGLGSPAGSLIPKDKAFVFIVKKNEMRYIGAVVGDRDLLRQLAKKGISQKEAYKEIISYREYGLAKPKAFLSSEIIPGEPFLEFFIIDEKEEAIPKFISEFPEYKKADIVIDLMH